MRTAADLPHPLADDPAADLLTERTQATVAEVARTVGYSDAFGFSAAFKRVRGVAPSEFRRIPVGEAT